MDVNVIPEILLLYIKVFSNTLTWRRKTSQPPSVEIKIIGRNGELVGQAQREITDYAHGLVNMKQ